LITPMVITGAGGFIGSRFLKVARGDGSFLVCALRSHSTAPSSLAQALPDAFAVNPSDSAMIEQAEILVHIGAFIPKHADEINDSVRAFSNVTLTEKLLGLPWKNLKKVVYLSTIDVYGAVNETIDESTPTNPQSLYAISKLQCEEMVNLFAAERGIRSQILRVGHVYGPGEEQYAKLIPRTISRILSSQNVEIWGSGMDLRSFIHVDDVVSGILSATSITYQPTVINMVSGASISVRDLVSLLVKMGGEATPIVIKKSTGTATNFIFDNSKMRDHLLPIERDFEAGLLEEFGHMTLQKAAEDSDELQE